MRYPLDELLDKRSIIQLKIERGNSGKDRERLTKEFQDYTFAIGEYVKDGTATGQQISGWYKELSEVNGKIWNLEDDIRKGKVGHLSLEEVGRTALRIRESNGIRVGIKAKVVQTTGIGYREIKVNHASEESLKDYGTNP